MPSLQKKSDFYQFSNRQQTWSRDFLRRGCEVTDDPDLVVVDVEDDGFVELHGVGLDVGCHEWKIGALNKKRLVFYQKQSDV